MRSLRVLLVQVALPAFPHCCIQYSTCDRLPAKTGHTDDQCSIRYVCHNHQYMCHKSHRRVRCMRSMDDRCRSSWMTAQPRRHACRRSQSSGRQTATIHRSSISLHVRLSAAPSLPPFLPPSPLLHPSSRHFLVPRLRFNPLLPSRSIRLSVSLRLRPRPSLMSLGLVGAGGGGAAAGPAAAGLRLDFPDSTDPFGRVVVYRIDLLAPPP